MLLYARVDSCSSQDCVGGGMSYMPSTAHHHVQKTATCEQPPESKQRKVCKSLRVRLVSCLSHSRHPIKAVSIPSYESMSRARRASPFCALSKKYIFRCFLHILHIFVVSLLINSSLEKTVYSTVVGLGRIGCGWTQRGNHLNSYLQWHLASCYGWHSPSPIFPSRWINQI